MDVEKIQKVNSLAINLMRQGLANDRDQAIKMAEDILDNGRGQGVKMETNQNYMQQQVSTPPPSMVANYYNHEKPSQVTSNQQRSSNGLTLDKVEEILRKNQDFLIKKFNDYEEKISTLQQNVKSLQQSLSNQQKANNQPATQVLQEQTIQKPSTPEPQKESHPKNGLFGDHDVSIEKFFYMGTK